MSDGERVAVFAVSWLGTTVTLLTAGLVFVVVVVITGIAALFIACFEPFGRGNQQPLLAIVAGGGVLLGLAAGVYVAYFLFQQIFGNRNR
jgi:hypothetical protein